MTTSSAPHVLVIETPGLGDRSYVVHDGVNALVIDPQRDIDRVEQLIAEHGLTMSHIAETHIHNDYVSGGLELARRHDAVYVVPADVDLAFDAVAVADGATFEVGQLSVVVHHTPGHTPHHISFEVRRADHVGVVFTGGSMLFGAVGRPDLVSPELVLPLAHDQWRSVRRLAAGLPGATHVYPTHGFGSFCAATQAEGVSGTVDDECAVNPALTQDEDAFVEATLAGLDVFPAYYAHMGPANAAGPDAPQLRLPKPVDTDELRRRIDAGEWVVDLRSREVFARGHGPGTLSFDLDGPFVAYLPWLLPVGAPITLLGETSEQVSLAQRELVRVGIDQIVGQAVGGPSFWLGDAFATAAVARTDFAGLARVISDDVVVLDTRQILEWEAGHIFGARHMPFYDVHVSAHEIPRDRPVYVYCGSGYRAAAVISLLTRQGFDNLVHVDDDWDNAARADLPIVSEVSTTREPGWTWLASRALVREHVARS
jgi:glyoxylase-like metal-dependent hydrolase (beta-lactamase superfamily II)/rhodanese-related sulfurtransferase